MYLHGENIIVGEIVSIATIGVMYGTNNVYNINNV